MRPSHWIFQTPLGHCCPGRLLPVYTSLSTSSKTYCISASCFSLSFSLSPFVSLHAVVFVSHLVACFFRSSLSAVVLSPGLAVSSHLLCGRRLPSLPSNFSFILSFLLLFCPFSVQRCRCLSACSFYCFLQIFFEQKKTKTFLCTFIVRYVV